MPADGAFRDGAAPRDDGAAFRDRVALVTGGASGIGRATVERLAAEGAQVVVADIVEDEGRAVAEAVGGRFAVLDVTEPMAWAGLVEDIRVTEGSLDLVHLNAGVTTGEADLVALTNAQYRRIMGVNVDGVVFGVRAALPTLSEQGGGGIVVTASMSSLFGFAHDPIYTLTKHAVLGLVRALAPSLEAAAVRVNAICPAVVDTPLVGPEAKSMLESVGFPLITPALIADVVVRAATSGRSGEAWLVTPGREPAPFEFARVPGLDDFGLAEGDRQPGQ